MGDDKKLMDKTTDAVANAAQTVTKGLKSAGRVVAEAMTPKPVRAGDKLDHSLGRSVDPAGGRAGEEARATERAQCADRQGYREVDRAEPKQEGEDVEGRGCDKASIEEPDVPHEHRAKEQNGNEANAQDHAQGEIVSIVVASEAKPPFRTALLSQ